MTHESFPLDPKMFLRFPGRRPSCVPPLGDESDVFRWSLHRSLMFFFFVQKFEVTRGVTRPPSLGSESKLRVTLGPKGPPVNHPSTRPGEGV